MRGVAPILVAVAACAAGWIHATRCQPQPGVDPRLAAAAGAPAGDPDGGGAASTAVLRDARGIELFVRSWPAAGGGPARGAVLLSHGYAWHSAGFARLAALLNAEGFAAVGFDLPSHGRSGGPAGCRGCDPGAGAGAWVDALGLVFDHMQERLAPPGAPCFIYAESVSGALALQLLQRPAPASRAAGAAVVGAAGGATLRELGLPAPLRAALVAAGAVSPRWRLPLPESVRRAGFAAQFGDTGKGATTFDSDPWILRDWHLCNLGTAAAALQALYASDLSTITTPVLVLQGGADAMLPPAGAARLAERLVGSSAARAELLPGMRHWLSQETDANLGVVFGKLLGWLEEHLDSGGGMLAVMCAGCFAATQGTDAADGLVGVTVGVPLLGKGVGVTVGSGVGVTVGKGFRYTTKIGKGPILLGKGATVPVVTTTVPAGVSVNVGVGRRLQGADGAAAADGLILLGKGKGIAAGIVAAKLGKGAAVANTIVGALGKGPIVLGKGAATTTTTTTVAAGATAAAATVPATVDVDVGVGRRLQGANGLILLGKGKGIAAGIVAAKLGKGAAVANTIVGALGKGPIVLGKGAATTTTTVAASATAAAATVPATVDVDVGVGRRLQGADAADGLILLGKGKGIAAGIVAAKLGKGAAVANTIVGALGKGPIVLGKGAAATTTTVAAGATAAAATTPATVNVDVGVGRRMLGV
ncbi:MAG: Alpha/Beta hydrolase protein [Monoraphidium minutum]|nr:MAG: Alpha/Beta hydrolase protein [Monoraphidium minutum]